MEINSSKPKLQIIIASVRPGRVGLPIGEWIRDRAVDHAAFEVELIDLAEVALPFMDEPNHPRFHNYIHQHTQEWSARISSGDAFIFVTPEYNYGMSAVLKNALDYLHQEWQYKPAGFASYGGISAGTRAVQMTKQVIGVLKMVPVGGAVAIPFVNNFFNDEKQFQPTDSLQTSLQSMLDEMVTLEAALRPLRTTVPLGSVVRAA